MRIAVLILGLVLGAIMFLQTFLVYGLSGIGNDAESRGAGAIGLMMAIMWLVGCAAVLGAPLVAAAAFGIAGFLGYLGHDSFHDLGIWAQISGVLAIMSGIGWRTKKRDESTEAQRHAELLTAVSGAAMTSTQRTIASGEVRDLRLRTASTCRSCSAMNPEEANYCAECGAQLR